MKQTFACYIDELADKHHLRSDSDAGRLLGHDRAAIHNWRHGKNAPDDDTCIKLADMLHREPAELLAAAALFRAKTPKARKVWGELVKRFASTTDNALAVLAITSLLTTPTDSTANQELTTRSVTSYTLYALHSLHDREIDSKHEPHRQHNERRRKQRSTFKTEPVRNFVCEA